MEEGFFDKLTGRGGGANLPPNAKTIKDLASLRTSDHKSSMQFLAQCVTPEQVEEFEKLSGNTGAFRKYFKVLGPKGAPDADKCDKFLTFISKHGIGAKPIWDPQTRSFSEDTGNKGRPITKSMFEEDI
jgi:hypothetical protein